jgi:hypothetical protein
MSSNWKSARTEGYSSAGFEGYAFWRVPRHPVKQRSEHLRRLKTHIFVSLVDHQLLHHQLILGRAGHPLGQSLNRFIQIDRTLPPGSADG